MTDQIRSPHQIPHQPVNVLVKHWSDARTRTVLAKYTERQNLDPEDLFTELAYGTRIAREVTVGQWCAVADLLRADAVKSWAEVGTAVELTETEARDRFHDWISGQVRLRRTTGTLGITEAEADELYVLSEQVVW